jgi:hypothetical protein
VGPGLPPQGCLDGSLTTASPTGILVAHYLQSITPCLALGGELVYHRRPGEEGTAMSLAGKYTREAGVAAAGRGPGSHMPESPW